MWRVTRVAPARVLLAYTHDDGAFSAQDWAALVGVLHGLLENARRPLAVVVDFTGAHHFTYDMFHAFTVPAGPQHPRLARLIIVSEAPTPQHQMGLARLEAHIRAQPALSAFMGTCPTRAAAFAQLAEPPQRPQDA